MITELEAGSAINGVLPQGCVQCREGAKLVLLITGLCSRRCWYCPLSEEKAGLDVTFANERACASVDEVLEEARAMNALGTGITGGDPLEVAERCSAYIRRLKSTFEEKHHIHLYTPTHDIGKIRKVTDAGLDELRLHPPPSAWSEKGLSPYLDVVREFRNTLSVGFEVPVIPGMETELAVLIDAAEAAGADFVNLNELEFSTVNLARMQERGMTSQDEFCTAAAGSAEAGRRLLDRERNVNVHFCSSPYKDSVQLRKRLVRRGGNVKREYEVLTDDGTLILGVVPGGREELSDVVSTLEKAGVDGELWFYDSAKRRLEVAPWVLEELHAEFDRPAFIVEEYASFDRLEVERTPLA